MAQSSKRDIIAMRKREAGVHVLVSGSSTGHCQLTDRSRSAVLVVGQDRDLLSTDSDRPIRVLAQGRGGCGDIGGSPGFTARRQSRLDV